MSCNSSKKYKNTNVEKDFDIENKENDKNLINRKIQMKKSYESENQEYFIFIKF